MQEPMSAMPIKEVETDSDSKMRKSHIERQYVSIYMNCNLLYLSWFSSFF